MWIARIAQRRGVSAASFLYRLYTGSVLMLCLLLSGSPVLADELSPESIRQNPLNAAESGVFLMRTATAGDAPAQYTPATLLNTEVDIKVSGPIAKVTLKQRFFNQGQAFAEGIYVFPLPEQSAVNGMEMRLGQRRIVGEIQPRQKARQIYQQAKREGKRAALLEQQRDNLFTSSVANIAAGESIEVSISYIETLQLDGNRFSLRLPLTLTPRFIPTDRIQPDAASAITPPQVAAQDVPAEWRNPVTLRAYIDAGQAIEQLHSPYHRIHSRYDGHGYQVSLRDPQIPADRDFVLHWDIANGEQSSAAFYTETIAGEEYGLLMLMPPQHAAQPRVEREVIFIIDTSGSMGGESIRQAQQSLQYALRRLQPGDGFNVIEFNSQFSQLFGQMRPASTENIREALAFAGQLQADGGTEMLPALRAALTLPGDVEKLRQVVFITDGAVGNESELFALIHQLLGKTRLFTVGIGSAPNSYFMRKAAEFGRGSFTHIGKPEEVDAQMSALFRKLEHPAVQDIRIQLPEGVEAEMWPATVPDVYLGEPVLVAMKLNRQPERFLVSGQSSGRNSQRWQREVELSAPRQHSGIGTLWARRKISALLDRITRGEQAEAAEAELVQVALAHQLSSRYTSFVAVDKTPVRDPGSPLNTTKVANLLPKGIAFPATASGVQLWWWLGGLLMLCAAIQRRLQRARTR